MVPYAKYTKVNVSLYKILNKTDLSFKHTDTLRDLMDKKAEAL